MWKSAKRPALSVSLYGCHACIKAQFWALYLSGSCLCVSVMRAFCEKIHNTLSYACTTYFHFPILMYFLLGTVICLCTEIYCLISHLSAYF